MNDNLWKSLGGSQVNLCPRDRLKALGVCLRKIPRAFNLALGQKFTWLPPRLVHRLSQGSKPDHLPQLTHCSDQSTSLQTICDYCSSLKWQLVVAPPVITPFHSDTWEGWQEVLHRLPPGGAYLIVEQGFHAVKLVSACKRFHPKS